MKIKYSQPFWTSDALPEMRDIIAPFSPVSKIHLWLRDDKSLNSRGWAAVHEFHCLYICLKNQGRIEIDGIPYLIKTNEALGVLPHHPHRRLKTDPEAQYLLLRFEPADPLQIESLFNNTLQLDDSCTPYIQDVVTSYEKVFADNTPFSRNELGLRISLLLNTLSMCVKSKMTAENYGNKRMNEVMRQLITKENLGLSLQEIAKKIGITPGHLTDIVHDTLGYSPRHIKQVVRFRLAADRLLHTTLSVSEIAEKTGFKSVYAFSRFFKKVSGTSPVAYRKKYGRE